VETQELFDVAIIGAGPGGYVAAIRAHQLGLRTAIIEKDARLGGTCLLRGCIPTKVLLHDAALLGKIRRASKHGFKTGEVEVDFSKVQKRKNVIVSKLTKGIEHLMKKNEVTCFKGTATLAGPGHIVVDRDGATAEVRAKHVIVATGSEPRSLPGYDVDGQFVITNNEALDLESIPRSMVIVGAGAVGVEFASIYSSFGTSVTLLEVLPRLVPIEDEDVSAELRRTLKKQGIEVHTEARLESATVRKGALEVVFRTAKGEEKRVQTEKLLMATGRSPNTSGIGLEKLGVVTDDKGYVQVNEYMETNVSGVYAIGDIVPTPWLAHVASHEGVVAVERIAGGNPVPMRYGQVPGCTYCEPQVASVGLTEAAARAAGHSVKVGKFPFTALSKAMIEGATDGFVKVVADEQYGEILGVHMIGSGVTELIAEAVASIGLEATAEDLIHTIHAHPTLSEAVHEAMEGVYGVSIHM
jgi:dihydrolipoamide dehydrogenase